MYLFCSEKGIFNLANGLDPSCFALLKPREYIINAVYIWHHTIPYHTVAIIISLQLVSTLACEHVAITIIIGIAVFFNSG